MRKQKYGRIIMVRCSPFLRSDASRANENCYTTDRLCCWHLRQLWPGQLLFGEDGTRLFRQDSRSRGSQGTNLHLFPSLISADPSNPLVQHPRQRHRARRRLPHDRDDHASRDAQVVVARHDCPYRRLPLPRLDRREWTAVRGWSGLVRQA